MASKSKKSSPEWTMCEKCQAVVKDIDKLRHEGECPPSLESCTHDFIFDGELYSTLQLYKPSELPENMLKHDLHNLVFLPPTTLQKCNISIGESVILSTLETVIVKTAWPNDENVSSNVGLTEHAMYLNDMDGFVRVSKLDVLLIAKEFIITPVATYGMSERNADLQFILKHDNEGKIFTLGNNISVPFYGRTLVYKIAECKFTGMWNSQPKHVVDGDLAKTLNNLPFMEETHFYKAQYSTKWTISESNENGEEIKKKPKYTINDIGGYDNLIEDVKDAINIALGKCQSIGEFCISKGVLLYGSSGVGKSMIANALISSYDVASFIIQSSDIYSKSHGETEQKLKDIFTKAKKESPSIILMEDIDTLCPKRSNASTDHDRRILTALVALFDDLQNTNEQVLVLATTSNIQFVDMSIRRPGRIDKEFEIYVPTPHMRTEILLKLLSKFSHTLTDTEISNISSVTHGFVGADLYGLCSQAIMSAIKRQEKTNIPSYISKVTMDDFHYALKVTKPSAMKEVLVEVPDVKWSDIGGQADLKLKLKQAVEWPLKHPEAFKRMGITPPKGVLMYGPPGCSKTMIAKALATEVKVNFLNIKGPELFSKWVGESEKAVREVFRKARQLAPSILFIDEIDALGAERSSGSGNGSNVQERVLAQLLTELDGITTLGDVTLVAATNRPDKIDKALIRPGRFDRVIYVSLPDDKTREEIFCIKLRNMPVSKEVNIVDLVDLTEGYSGAEIQAICHEAAMKALEEDINADIITIEHFKAGLSLVTPRIQSKLVKWYDEYIDMSY